MTRSLVVTFLFVALTANLAHAAPSELETVVPEALDSAETARSGDESPGAAVAPVPVKAVDAVPVVPLAPTLAVDVVPKLPLDVGANLFTRYEMRQGYDRLGVSAGRFLEGDWLVYRARLNLSTMALPIGRDLTARVYFSPQAAGWWGDRPNTITTPSLGVYEGFVRLQHRDWSLDVGRFRLNYGDALVIGDLDWHQVGRSFDGARIRFAPPAGRYWVDAFVTQTGEGSRLFDGTAGFDSQPAHGDAYFGGVYGSFGGLVSAETTLEPYVLNQFWGESLFDDGSRVGSALQTTAGVRGVQAIGPVDVRFEPGVQFGRRRSARERQSVFAYQADLEVGFTPVKPLRVSIEGAYATGNDASTRQNEAWDELYPTTHKWLGLMDVIGIRSNIMSLATHAQLAAGDFKIACDAHAFWREEPNTAQQAYAGTEIDLNVVYMIGKGMSLRVLGATFLPGPRHYPVASPRASRDAYYMETQYTFVF